MQLAKPDPFSPCARTRLSPRWIFLAVMLMLAVPVLAETYEVVRGKQFQLCRDLAKNLNEFKNDPPMVCERRFSPKYKDFRRPAWRLLPSDQVVQAAIAIERARLNPRNEAKYESLVQKEAEEIKDAAASGKLKVWEARFDIARNRERPRVVMAVRGICEGWSESWSNPREPRIGVLLEGKFEVDPRYERFSTIFADLFFYQGLPYLASWETYPGAIGREPGPRKRHRAYVFAWDTFWLPPGTQGADSPGSGNFNGPICQIGYQRIK